MELIQKENGFYYYEHFNELAYITFYRSGDILNVDHTFVDYSLRGQGMASQLVLKVIEYAKINNLKINPICSYVVSWFEDHPEYQDILKESH